MSFKVKGKIGGVGDVLKKLDALKKAVRNKVLRQAVGDAAKALLWAAKAGTPQATGLLRKSLGRKVKVYRNSGVVVGLVGPRSGFKTAETTPGGKPVYRNPTRYAHLVERGTRLTPARPFLADAFRSTAAAAEELIRSRIESELARLAP